MKVISYGRACCALRHRRVVFSAAFLLSAGFVPSGSWLTQAAADVPLSVYAPRVLHYDIETDTFVHQSSVYMPPPRKRLHDDVRYYGNRLTQFRFVGPARQSGIYGGIERYQRAGKRRSKNYRYHW